LKILHKEGFLVKKLLTGNETIVLAALSAGAELFFGYPITPTTEILEHWIDHLENDHRFKGRHYLQTEDEIAAGFAAIGAILGGKKTFTATAGPGNVLMQDAITMAEAMRLPFVGIIMGRGGPSTGTVIYSQQEINLTCFGGNGEGLRIVYAPSNLQELYDYTIKVFQTAWKYRFPTFLLGDGYQAKTKSIVELKEVPYQIKTKKILGSSYQIVNIRNTFSQEEDLYDQLEKDINEYLTVADKIAESEFVGPFPNRFLVIAFGTVALASKEALKLLDPNLKVSLLRPITLRPLDKKRLRIASKEAKKIIIIESSYRQLSSLIRRELGHQHGEIIEISRPALGFTPEEIAQIIREQIG
jgi:2-oxoglutarate ferredoxin oxidoreductase subunit alpha